MLGQPLPVATRAPLLTAFAALTTAAIVLFLVLHVVMALIVPRSLRAMIAGR